MTLPFRLRSEVVILVPEEDSEPYGVLSWNDDVDEPAAAGRGRTGAR
jgi:hypothetical protein